LSAFKEIVRHEIGPAHDVTNVSIVGNPAAEIDSRQPGEYEHTIQAFHHGNMIQLTTPPNRSETLLPSFAQLRQIVAIIVRRF
jgi:hypothetical protein